MTKTKGAFKVSLFIILSGLLILNLSTSFVKDMDARIFNPIDHRAEQYIDASLKKAMISFGITKAMNAVISFFQETTLVIQPLGVGVGVAAGQVLDPLNDMVERASWVFLASATSLGVQRIFLQINQWLAVSVLLNGFLICALFSVFVKRFVVDIPGTVFKLGLLILFVRCFIPFSYLINHHLYQTFMHDTYIEQVGILEEQKNQMDALSGKVRRSIPSRDEIVSIFTQISHFTKDASDRLIEMIIVFTTQVIILPLAFLWIFLQGIKSIIKLKLDISTTLWQGYRHDLKTA